MWYNNHWYTESEIKSLLEVKDIKIKELEKNSKGKTIVIKNLLNQIDRLGAYSCEGCINLLHCMGDDYKHCTGYDYHLRKFVEGLIKEG